MPAATDLVSSPITSQKSRRDRFSLFHRRKGSKKNLSGALPDSPPTGRCCLPRRKRTNVAATTNGRSVHFGSVIETKFTGPTDFSNRSTTPKLVKRRSRSARRSESRKSFYSTVSTLSAVKRLREVGDGDDDDLPSTTKPDAQTAVQGSGLSTRESSVEPQEGQDQKPPADVVDTVAIPCPCGFPAHLQFDPRTPIVTGPGVEPGSYEELLIHAKAQVGNWATILSRSDSLDPQMIHVGLSKMKRMVMNRLAIPFTAVLEENDTLLHCWITTPVGAKHTNAGLKGQITEDKDSDLGDWTARTTMVDYSIKWFCGGKTVRAMQMKRENPTLGTAYETRICLPDKEEGLILLYNITIVPGNGKANICVDRIYKFASP